MPGRPSPQLTMPPIADAPGGETLVNLVTKVNALLAELRKAGYLRSS